MKILKIMVVAALVLCLPAGLAGQGFVDLGDFGAAHAKNGDNGKGGGKSDNGRSGDRGSSGKSDRSKSDKGGKSDGKSSRSTSRRSETESKAGKSGGLGKTLEKIFGPKKKTASATKKQQPVKVARKPATKPSKSAGKTAVVAGTAAAGTLDSQLKSLHSLNRNINGLMNGNDPKMDPFRDFIEATIANEEAQELREAAIAEMNLSAEAFKAVAEKLALPNESFEAAQAELTRMIAAHAEEKPAEPVAPVAADFETEAEFRAASDQYTTDLAAWTAWNERDAELAEAKALSDELALDMATYAEADARAIETEAASSDTAMREAMAASLNATGARQVSADDMTDEMAAWVADRLGVAESDGLIDDYRASLEAEPETPALEEEDVGDASPDGGNEPTGDESEVILTATSE